MVKWLNRDEDSPSDIDMWKIELDDYTLENLRIWGYGWIMEES